MGTIIEKLDYLDETKSKIREAIEYKGGIITDDTPFRQYADILDDVVITPPTIDLPMSSEISLINKRELYNDIRGIGSGQAMTYKSFYDVSGESGYPSFFPSSPNHLVIILSDDSEMIYFGNIKHDILANRYIPQARIEFIPTNPTLETLHGCIYRNYKSCYTYMRILEYKTLKPLILQVGEEYKIQLHSSLIFSHQDFYSGEFFQWFSADARFFGMYASSFTFRDKIESPHILYPVSFTFAGDEDFVYKLPAHFKTIISSLFNKTTYSNKYLYGTNNVLTLQTDNTGYLGSYQFD